MSFQEEVEKKFSSTLYGNYNNELSSVLKCTMEEKEEVVENQKARIPNKEKEEEQVLE